MRRTARNPAGKNAGFTLIEVMAAIAVFAVIVTAFLQVLMSISRTNRSIAASMTANSVIRSVADEALAAATENAPDFDGNFARAFVNYYGSIDSGETLPIGGGVPRVEITDGGNVLTYRFVVPEPGFHSRYASSTPWSGGLGAGDLIPYERGLGEMRIYLNEEAMPDADGMFGGAGGLAGNAVWEPIGDNPGDPGDGGLRDIDGTTLSGFADLRNPPEKLNRVFADIRVTYYGDDGRTDQVTLNERRIFISASMDMQDYFG